ncbi:MAG: hypothetical protein H0X64_00810 [Gemmatimonadaceae bacterium]|nr:hypothetical protein [Gemmatimonadaceae bacterium]
MSAASDTVDLVEVGRSLGRGWRTIGISVGIGLLIGVLVLWLVPRRFEGVTTVVVRSDQGGGASLLARLGLGDAASSAGGGLLPGGAGRADLNTEVEILSSRALIGQIVDSLHLQVEVRDPAGMPASDVVEQVRLPGSFKDVKVTLERRGDGWATGDGDVLSSRTVRVARGVVQLAPAADNLQQVTLRIFDREDAIQRVSRRLDVSKGKGEVIEVAYSGRDSLTASAVPNSLAAAYLARRRTTDRGTNRHKVEFLTAQLDSVRDQLGGAELALQSFQESSGLVDGTTISKIQLEAAGDLRKEVGTIDVERGALLQLMDQVAQGRMSARQLAAYPSFLRSPAINDLLSQMAQLETERLRLLERRLETDAEVVAMDRSIASLEGQLVPMARAYQTSLERQRNDLGRQLDTLRTSLSALPAAMVAGGRRQREVVRLNQIHGALQAQLVEARLAAVGEGGDATVLDAAKPAKKAQFPPRAATLTAGVGGGLIAGILIVLIGGTVGRWVDDPRAIERIVGMPTVLLERGAPLLVGSGDDTRTVLLLPLDVRTSTAGVAERLARTAMARGITATVLDLSDAAGVADTMVGPTIKRLEAEHGLVIVRLPQLDADATAAALANSRPVLLVAPADRVDRRELMGTVAALRHLEVPCAGVVMNRTSDAALLRA